MGIPETIGYYPGYQGLEKVSNHMHRWNYLQSCPLVGFWVFRTLTLACSHAAFPILPYESDCNPKGSISTKRQ